MLGLEGSKGSLTAGRDADLVIFDQSADMTIVPRMIQHRHKLTPYEGLTFKGTVLKTIVRGRVVFDGAVVTEHPSGVPLLKGQRPCELRK